MRAKRTAIGAGLLFLLLYSLTLAPGLLPADSGEYQVAGAVLGVAHPPGFALYTIASWLISRVPVAAPAVAINWLSALLAAAALALVAYSTTRLTGSMLAGLGATLALGFSTTFWAQATTANIRMPAALATAWAFERLLNYRAAVSGTAEIGGRSSPAASLAWLAFALGLGVAHHASLAFIALVFGLYALSLRPAGLRRPWPLLAGLLPFLSWLYFPLRAGAFGAPERIATAAGFLEHVLARGFAGDMFFFATPQALPERLAIFTNILTFQFAWPVLGLMLVGAVAAFWINRQVAAVLLAAVTVHVFVAITYRAPQTVEYLLPAYVLMAMWVGLGIAALALGLGRILTAARATWRRPAASALPAFAALLVVLTAAPQFIRTFPSYWRLAQDDGTREYALALLQAAPPNAAILASWHWATPLWYLQQVEGYRPDVDVRYVFPSGESLGANWAGQIARTLPERPVVVTSYFEGEYQALPYRFVPLGPAWEARLEPLTTPPPSLTGEQAFGDWTFLGYAVEALGPEGAEVLAAWRSEAMPEDVSFFVHLLDPAGALHSQHDVHYPAARYVAGEILINRYVLPLRPDAAAGDYALVAGAYRPAGGRLAEVPLTHFAARPPALGTARIPPSAVPLGNAMWLAGSRIIPAGPIQPGQRVTVQLEFVAARPLTADYSVSVSLTGPDWHWRVQSDGTPAGGAIPTLKWIAGSRVIDTRTLIVPADAAPGPAQLALVVYDAFTQQVLPTLDPVLATQGVAVPLGTVEVQAAVAGP